jgi:Derlin-2/3
MLLSPLTLALAYTYAQENPNMQLNYFVVTFSAKWLPLAMLAMTLVMASPYAALIQASGLVAAHAYDFLTIYWPQRGGGRQLIWTPEFVARAFAPLAGSATRRGAGTAFNARPGAASARASTQNLPQRPPGGSGGWASGFNGGAWNERGTGRRLGGD